MSPEEITRALAQRDAPRDRDYGFCLLCYRPGDDDNAPHHPDCPWLAAVEWARTEGGDK